MPKDWQTKLEMEAKEAAADTEKAVDRSTTELNEEAKRREKADMDRPMLTAPAVSVKAYANAHKLTTRNALTAKDLGRVLLVYG